MSDNAKLAIPTTGDNGKTLAYNESGDAWALSPVPVVIPPGGSLAATQAAVNALGSSFKGVVTLAPGEHDWNGTLTLRSNVTINGYGANIFQAATTGAVMGGTDLDNVTLRGFKLWGPGQTTGSGSGISLAISAADNTPYIHIEDVQCWEFGGSGMVLAGLLASNITGCVSALHGGYGFDLTQAGFGTSVEVTNCFANACYKAGYRLTRMTYCSLNACATDDCGIGYELVDCSGISLNACGCEVPVDNNAAHGTTGYTGTAYKVNGSASVVFNGCFALGLAQSPGGPVGWWFTGSSTHCLLSEAYEVDPGTSPTAALKVDAGSTVRVVDPRFQTAISNAGTIFYLDGSGYIATSVGATTYTPDMTTGTVHQVNLTGNATIAAPTNGHAGMSLTLIFLQSSGTTNTATLNSVFKRAGGSFTASTGASAKSSIAFVSDGTNWIEVGRALAVA